ncbi:MAG: c-type cytochrome [Gemmataceae bacterium]
MRLSLWLGWLLLCLVGASVSLATGHAGDEPAPAPATHVQSGLRLPKGFEVTEVADGALAADIHCLTLDPQGRPVVSGRGYIRLLVDDDGDGRLDRALDFADAPRDGAMGLHWDGNDLYCVGDGGLRVYRDAGGAGRTRPSSLLFRCRTGGEHHAHAVGRGPDGWLYLLVGDGTGITSAQASLPTSPIRAPIGGCVVRFPPDLKGSEIVAHGFRNPYGMDWNSDGELFTYDSDNERCVSLPWYEPTRLYHVRPGGHHGWLAPQYCSTWRLPPYLLDVVPPVATLGRGSPTGVVCYRHTQFPPRYQGGLFLLDWTFGQIHFVRLERQGTTYRATPELFLRSVGDNGFAPVAGAVHPRTGDLIVAVGGRGTRGAVYRVRHPQGLQTLDLAAAARLQPRRQATPSRTHAAAPRVGQERLDAVRKVQLGLGDVGDPRRKGTVWEGYSLRKGSAPPGDPGAELRRQFPSGDATIDRELSRTLAMLEDGDADLLNRIVGKLTDTSDPVEDIHYLIVLARLSAARSEAITQKTARALLALDVKLEARQAQRDRNWPLRLAELHVGLAARDARLNRALVSDPGFGRPDHALFCRCPGFDRKRAAQRFLERSTQEGFTWNADLIALIGALPAEQSLPVLRRLWGEQGLDEVILPWLARAPQSDDRARLLGGLTSANLQTVKAALGAIERLPLATGSLRAEESLAMALSLRQLTPGKEEDALRARLLARITRLADRKLNTPDEAIAWVQAQFPTSAARLREGDGVDTAAWQKRLGSIDFTAGDAKRGQAVYVKASCAACHSGAAALGPDLRGVAGRFSRDDLFTAILRPSKDVPSRYRTTQLTTTTGQSYQGIIVYEAVDSVLMLTGPGQSIRLAHAQIAERRLRASSLMPSGLLDRLRNEEIADLYAYLRSLK